MDSKLTKAVEDLEGATDDAEMALRAAQDAQAQALNVALPGKVLSYDEATQTAKVQLGIKRAFRGQDPVNLPPLVDCPVQMPGGSWGSVRFALEEGATCYVVFADRAIDLWWSRGGEQPPSEWRMHDLSDGFCFPGFNPAPLVPPTSPGAAIELISKDGATRVTLGKDGSVAVISGKSQDVSITAAGNASIQGGAILLGLSAALPAVPGLPDAVARTMPFPVGAPGPASGVVLASDICAMTGLPHGAHGCGSSKVQAAK